MTSHGRSEDTRRGREEDLTSWELALAGWVDRYALLLGLPVLFVLFGGLALVALASGGVWALAILAVLSVMSLLFLHLLVVAFVYMKRNDL